MQTHTIRKQRTTENTTAEFICEPSGHYSWERSYLQIGFELEQSDFER